MDTWYTAADLAGLPGLPGTERRVRARAERDRWAYRKRAKGKGLEYPFSALPAPAKAALLLKAAPKAERQTRADKATGPVIAAAWERYEAATQVRRDDALAAAAALDAVAALVAGGMGKTQAQTTVSAQQGCSMSSLYRWERQTRGAARTDWPALLLDGYVGRTAEAPCSEAAWDFYRGMYLDRAAQTHAECYRRLREVAAAQGWTVPSAKTLMRRVEDLDPLVVITAREGIEAAMRKVPSITRDETVYLAGQAVSGDGLKFDELWVKFPDGEILNTATGWFYQDVRTRRVLAWRLGKTESTDLFRLATYDLTAICAPEVLVLDNTRVAANTLMTGGAEHRSRFGKSKPQHGTGLLPMLGMRVQFTNPDKEVNNPGSKPIERAFGIGGLHSKVATNPEIRTYGAYSKATAVPFEVFKRVVSLEVARHNAQKGRRNRAAGGVLSLDQAWERADKFGRLLSDSQRRLLLMCRELVTVQQGVMQIAIKAGRNAHGANRYSAEGLARYAGRQAYVHYDPEALHAGAWLYDLHGRFLMPLQHIPTHAFNSKAAGDEVGKLRQRTRKALKRASAETQRMDAIERAQLYGEAIADLAPSATPPSDTTVVHGHFQRVPDPARDAERPGGEGRVVAPVFGVAQGSKVLADGTVVDMTTGEVLRTARPADGSLTEQEREEHDWLRRVAEARRREQW